VLALKSALWAGHEGAAAFETEDLAGVVGRVTLESWETRLSNSVETVTVVLSEESVTIPKLSLVGK